MVLPCLACLTSPKKKSKLCPDEPAARQERGLHFPPTSLPKAFPNTSLPKGLPDAAEAREAVHFSKVTALSSFWEKLPSV